jgi:Spy/CpxP family protein refolding chaperone
MPPPANRYGPPQGQYGSPRPSQYGPPFQEQLQDIKRSQLGPALGVDQATVERLLAIEQRYRSQKNQVNQGAMEDMQRLQQLMANPNPPEGEVKALLDNMNKRVQASRDLQQRQHEEETAVLTPVQQARYIMYKMQILKEARNVKKGPGPAAPLGPGKAPREVPVFRPSQPQ